MIRLFRNKLIPVFNFSSSERAGIIVLVFLILVIIAFNIYLPSFFSTNMPENGISRWEEVESFLKLQEKAKNEVNSKRKKYEQEEKQYPELFSFDPNSLSKKGWEHLGFENWQIVIIKNYMSKGGSFKIKSDLKKIYGIPDSTYFLLEPYILLPDKEIVETQFLRPDFFDPNKVQSKKLKNMGLDSMIINSIVNYREKGGRFYKKDDFKKIYGITDSLYEIFQTYINLPDKLDNSFVEKVIFTELEINKADTLDLQQLSGIGPGYAQRIAKYRDILGGYTDKKQLLEVYGMDSLRYNSFADQVKIDTSLIEKININEAGIKRMIQHPYIEFYIAKEIIVYREAHQGFKRVEELNKLDVIYSELYSKLAPYLYAGPLNLTSDAKRKKKLR